MAIVKNTLQISTALIALSTFGQSVFADAPCGDLDECRVLIEINASDGDIGFHVLFDAEGWTTAAISDPSSMPIFDESASNSLEDQTLTENFFESAEPVCEEGLREEPGDEVVTLPEFLLRFPAGTYSFSLDSGDRTGSTDLTHVIPAAPSEVDFDGKRISWEYGYDLGECTTVPGGFEVAGEDQIAGYEVVLEPDDDELSKFKFTIQVPPDVNEVVVPKAYLSSFDADTPLKVEVGAIERRPDGSFGNQTFTEADGFCAARNQKKCEDEDEEN